MPILLHTGILSNADDSLFTYLPYTSFNEFRDTDFRPVFTVNSSSTDVSMCGGDESCIFDLVTTNDLRVGAATLAAVNRIEETIQMSYPGKGSMCVCVSVSPSVYVCVCECVYSLITRHQS